MSDQPDLFGSEPPPVQPLPLPAGTAHDGLPKIRYLAYHGEAKCADCIHLSYERGLRKEHAPSIRKARWRRTVASRNPVLLCGQHKAERQLHDPAQEK